MAIYQRKPPFPKAYSFDALLRERGIEPAGLTDDPVQDMTAAG